MPGTSSSADDENDEDSNCFCCLDDLARLPTFTFLPERLLKKRWAKFNKTKQLEVLVEWSGKNITTWEPYHSLENKEKLEELSSLSLEKNEEEEDDEAEQEEGTYDVEVSERSK